MNRPFSRRLLLSAGAGSLALPLLPSLLRGQDAKAPPLRLVLFYHPNGTVAEHFWPEAGASESDFELGKILEPFAAYKDRLLIARGVDSTVAMDPTNNGGPHQRGIGALFTGQKLLTGQFKDGCGSAAGWADGPSIDQIVAQNIGTNTAFASLELGVRANINDVQGRISYNASGSPLPPTNDPVASYERLFLRGMPLDPSDPNSKSQAILDAVKDQVKLLQGKVGYDDRVTLQRHLALVEDLERRLSTGGGTSCEPPVAPDAIDPDSEMTMSQVSRLQLDLLAHAFSCDLTRVASVQYSTGFNQMRYPWIDDMGEGHALSHSGDSSTEAWDAFSSRVRWHAEEIAYFMDRLAEIPEGDGTALDNTLILWGSEITRGNSHALTDIPYVLLGNAGGSIASGRSISFDAASSCDYLRTVLLALGIEAPTFGHPDHTSGVLSGILS